MEHKLIIGSHVGVSGSAMLLGGVEAAISYGANAFMFYTGAPQNTRRTPIEKFRVAEAKQLMSQSGIKLQHAIVHAPYIINLANGINPSTREIAIEFLKKELLRVEEIGCTYLVLHPGSHVGQGIEEGIRQIVLGLNEVLSEDQTSVMILLESMSGKGSEVGSNIAELQSIYQQVEKKSRIGLCLDTCHLHDAGYDLENGWEDLLSEIDQRIGLNHIKVIHVNDSKNSRGAHKDRHENIGFGAIGFATLRKIIEDERFLLIPKILETPWIEGLPPYREEIKMIRSGIFEEKMKEELLQHAL